MYTHIMHRCCLHSLAHVAIGRGTRVKEKSSHGHPHNVFGPLSRGFCVAVDSPVCEHLVDVMDAYLTDPGSLDMVVWLSG